MSKSAPREKLSKEAVPGMSRDEQFMLLYYNDLTEEEQEGLASSTFADVRYRLAKETQVPAVQVKLAGDPDLDVRCALAENVRVCPEAQLVLASTKSHLVRVILLENRQVTKEAALRAFPDAPVVPNLDEEILRLVESGKGRLRMSDWHTCETTHCRAGWAVVLAGAAGKALEDNYGTEAAGAIIYVASTGRVPNFFASNEAAMEDMRRSVRESRGAPTSDRGSDSGSPGSR